jgi:hypothetical protein
MGICVTKKSTKEGHLYTPQLPFNIQKLFLQIRSLLHIKHP